MTKPRLAAAVFTAALFQALMPFLAQAPPLPANNEPPIPPAFSAVRRAWLVPEDEMQAVLQLPGTSLDQFAVAAMVSHAAGKPVSEVEAAKRKLGSWTEAIRAQGGELADLVFKGSARYNLEALPEAPQKESLSSSEERIVTLARVMTLERLTGKGPAVIAREMQAGHAFEDLLMAAMPANPETAPAKRQQEDGPPQHHRGQKGQPEMGLDEPSQGNHGHVGSG